jgi:hypothetical protein
MGTTAISDAAAEPVSMQETLNWRAFSTAGVASKNGELRFTSRDFFEGARNFTQADERAQPAGDRSEGVAHDIAPSRRELLIGRTSFSFIEELSLITSRRPHLPSALQFL